MGKRNHLKHRSGSGRATRAGHEREFAPTQAKRLRDAALAQMADAEWGTELGRLFIKGQISPAHYAAGKRLAEWSDRYRVAIAGPGRTKSGAVEVGRGATPPDPDSDRGRVVAKADAAHVGKFNEALAVLARSGDNGITRRVCEDDEAACAIGELISLSLGLSALVIHWRLDREAKSDQYRGRSAR